MSLSIRLAVLDWAGTSIDFGSCAPAFAFVKAFAKVGVQVAIEEARRPMGLHKKDHLRAMLAEPSLADRWQQAKGSAWTEADIETLYEIVTPMQVEAAGSRSTLTPGLHRSARILRERGVQVAHTTGYFAEAALTVTSVASMQGYRPDFTIGADDVPAGRPKPWMIFRCMEACNVFPPAAVVKVGDTLVDIEDGRNAGVWSVGIVDPSNLMGLTEEEFAQLTPADRDDRRRAIRQQYRRAGAHATLDTLTDLPDLIDDLNLRLAKGEKP
jgi:phosphonoacetaldehyde hydrolase